jgi:DNA-binding XRE family transcriptional regulator
MIIERSAHHMKTKEKVICHLDRILADRKIAGEKKISKIQIAREIGISKQAIYQIANSEFVPSLYNCLKIAKILECSVHDLWTIDETTNDKTAKVDQ